MCDIEITSEFNNVIENIENEQKIHARAVTSFFSKSSTKARFKKSISQFDDMKKREVLK